ncbi:DUF4893 domain-containing protein [Stakelama pacifica]|uniref:Uncharacterized protein DUF4893 n=1 Tax=Stakelama pacifica TaxID=517720 RepID=A0A4R6FJS7_9SPHN|nr:DUF4893 domain-containing protein [Stakelama pacifica]TDN81719.1 uncharacterized protein DUF4893 [Stakelama pacifica]GGO96357.1 DUF4893 domain-containing protein [Stakelama pacifica]
MAWSRLVGISIGVIVLGGCAHRTSAPADKPAPIASAPASGEANAVNWRQVATDADRARLRNWRDTWIEALAEARSADPQAIAADPALFDPDRALTDPLPPPGDYRCRTVKLGSAQQGLSRYVDYPGYPCRIEREDDVLSLTRYGGSQRPVGLIFPDTAARGVFLGTLMLGNQHRALDYGRDQDRDMAGFVERIGDARWRLALPRPAFESKLDLIEITPAP